MAVLVINAGSSSLKFSLFEGERCQARGLVDRLGASGDEKPRFSARGGEGKSIVDKTIEASDHDAPCRSCLRFCGSIFQSRRFSRSVIVLFTEAIDSRNQCDFRTTCCITSKPLFRSRRCINRTPWFRCAILLGCDRSCRKSLASTRPFTRANRPWNVCTPCPAPISSKE